MPKKKQQKNIQIKIKRICKIHCNKKNKNKYIRNWFKFYSNTHLTLNIKKKIPGYVTHEYDYKYQFRKPDKKLI